MPGWASFDLRPARWSELEAARAAVAVGEQAGQGRQGDLRRGPRADVEPDRAVHAGDLGHGDAQGGERLDVRALVMRIAHDPDPPGLGGQRVAEYDAELVPVMIGEDHVDRVVQVFGRDGEEREAEGGGAGRARLVRLEQEAAVPDVGTVSEQVTRDR